MADAKPLPLKPVSHSPAALAWRAFRRHRAGQMGMRVLIFFYLIAIFADFIAPYHYEDEERELHWAPPTDLHFSDQNGFSWRPFIHPIRGYIDDDFNLRQEPDTSRRSYLRFFVLADKHTFLGLFETRFRLFGFDEFSETDEQGNKYTARYYLLGADNAGRCIFSRICYGARISMTIGLLGTFLVLIIGLALGGVSGYVGGQVDNVLQRFGEMVMLLPGFYLLLLLRFSFPSNMDSTTVYFMVILILSLVGWAGLARVIRGMVLSIKTNDYVQAARAVGARSSRIIFRHILPNTAGYVIVSCTLSIPSYILGESGLSVLGLGIMDPVPSWGNMLQKATDILELTQHPWVLWPGLCIFLVVIAFNLVGDALRDALDPRRLHV